ncbi:MAG: serine hydrolase domain-containing protein, partial [Alphaproteobacteria bacterium]
MSAVPGKTWSHITPDEAGFDAETLQSAVAYALEHDSGIPLSLSDHLATRAFADGPWGETLGPTKDRATTYGVIVRNGAIAASWGEPGRVDMTF